MSSMRNAAPRRPHRERSQPGARSKWGLLEKHKDYSLRAADYNAKKKKLNILSQKSRERNPDEFAFGMLSGGSTRAGKHGRGDADKNRLSVDEVKLLKRQDAGYLRTVLGRTRREVEKVKESIGTAEALKMTGPSAIAIANEKKVLYDENGEPVRKRRKMSVDIFDDDRSDISGSEDEDGADYVSVDEDNDNEDPTDLNQQGPLSNDEDSSNPSPSHPPSKKAQLNAVNAVKQKLLLKRRRRRLREARATQLAELQKRQKSIMAAAHALEVQRAKMAGGVIGGVNKQGVKFRVRERKR